MAKKAQPSAGAPLWMVTYSDMVTLLLTFFVLLLSFAKTETAKYEAVSGSIKDAFGGNVIGFGEVYETGKSNDNIRTILDGKDEIRPFPIDFMTQEGFLDKLEINRESEENLKLMKRDIENYHLGEFVDTYRSPEGIQMKLKEDIIFETNSTKIKRISIASFDRVINLVDATEWKVVVSGYASNKENTKGQSALDLSAKRALVVTKALISRGVNPKQIITNFNGNATSSSREVDQKVEIMLRKADGNSLGQKVTN